MSEGFSYRMAREYEAKSSLLLHANAGFLPKVEGRPREGGGVWMGKDWFRGVGSESLLDNR